jgi:hypothetical protein
VVDVREKRVCWAVHSFFLAGRDGEAELLGISVDEDCGQQVQVCHTVVLTFSGAVADFALETDMQAILQGVVAPLFKPIYLDTSGAGADPTMTVLVWHSLEAEKIARAFLHRFHRHMG